MWLGLSKWCHFNFNNMYICEKIINSHVIVPFMNYRLNVHIALSKTTDIICGLHHNNDNIVNT